MLPLLFCTLMLAASGVKTQTWEPAPILNQPGYFNVPRNINSSLCKSEEGLASLVESLYPAVFVNASGADEKVARGVAGASALIWGTPALQFSRMLNMTKGATNMFKHTSRLPPAGTQLADLDMLPSFAVLDLAAGPVIVTLPPAATVGSRHFHLSLFSLYLDSLESVDSTDPDLPANRQYIILPPRYNGKPPAGFGDNNTIRSPYQFLALLLSVTVDGTSRTDLAAAVATQTAFSITPSNGVPSPVALKVTERMLKAAALAGRLPQIQVGGEEAVYQHLLAISYAVTAQPPLDTEEKVLLRVWKAVGLDLLKPSKLKIPYSSVLGVVVAQGCLQATFYKDVLEPLANSWSAVNWATGTYLDRARTSAGILMGSWSPALTLVSKVDSLGSFLHSPLTYTLSVPALKKGEGWWSLTVYDGFSGALFQNVTTNQLRSTAANLEVAADGSVSVLLSSHAPAANGTANWLPVPMSGAAYMLVLRIYTNESNNATSGTGRRRLAQSDGLSAPTAVQQSIVSQMGTGYNIYMGCPPSVCQTLVDPGLLTTRVLSLTSSNVLISDQDSCGEGAVGSTYYSSADLQYSSASSLGVSASYDSASFSGSASWGKTYGGSSGETLITLLYAQSCYTQKAVLNGPASSMALDQSFIDWVTTLISAYKANEFQETADQFVRQVGTHYLSSVNFGGFNSLRVQMSANSNANLASHGHSWGASAGADAASLEVGSSKQTNNSNSMDGTSFYSYFVISPASVDDPVVNGQFDLQGWYNNIVSSQNGGSSPVIVDFQVAPIIDLLSATYYSLYPSSISTSDIANVYTSLNSLLNSCSIGGCSGSASGCPSGTYATSTSMPPKCQSCFTGPPGCNYQYSSGCTGSSSNDCTCNDPYTGSKCESVNYGTCSYTYHMCNCNLAHNWCATGATPHDEYTDATCKCYCEQSVSGFSGTWGCGTSQYTLCD